MDNNNIESLKRRLKICRRNLNNLEEQKTSYGSLDVPVRILNQIEFEKEEIAHLEKEIAELERKLKDPDEVKEPAPEKESARGKMRRWWGSLKVEEKVAYIGLISVVIGAIIGLCGPVVAEVAELLLAATAPPVEVAPIPTPTLTATSTPTSTSTSTPTPTPTPTATPTNTPTSTPTSTATPTNTPTPTPTPDAVVVAPVNLRKGPGTVYDIINTLRPGQVLTVTGRITDAAWLQIKTDQMQAGWVINRVDLVTLNLPAEQIPIVSPSPTPTPTPTPTSNITGKVCEIWSGWDTSTIFLRQDEFNALKLPMRTKVTVILCDTGKTFDNVTLGLDSEMGTCVVRLSLPYREALGVAGDTNTPTPQARPDRQFDITQTSLPMNKEATNFQGKVCQIWSGQDTNTVFLRLPEYNDFGVPVGTTISVTVLDTGRTIERVTLGLDSKMATCVVRLARSLREALGVDGDTDIDRDKRPIRQFLIRLTQP